MERERHANAFILLALLMLDQTTESASSPNVSRSRVNRAIDALNYNKYLVFPRGSNVQLIYCLTIGSFARPRGLFTLGVTAGLAYELPHRRRPMLNESTEIYHRRSRRDLYRKLEATLDTQSIDARGCLLKALCRAGKRNREERRLGPRKASFLHEILHSIFTFENTVDEDEYEHEDQRMTRHYQEAYNARDDCDELFHADSCPWLL